MTVIAVSAASIILAVPIAKEDNVSFILSLICISTGGCSILVALHGTQN